MRKYYIYGGMFLLNWMLTSFFRAILLPSLLLLSVPFFLDSIEECKGYENIWVFPIVIVESFFLNVCFLDTFIPEIGLYGPTRNFLMYVIFYLILLCFEEMIIGKITRRLFRKQKQIKF